MYNTDIDVKDLMMPFNFNTKKKKQKHGTNWIEKKCQIQQLEIWVISMC